MRKLYLPGREEQEREGERAEHTCLALEQEREREGERVREWEAATCLGLGALGVSLLTF